MTAVVVRPPEAGDDITTSPSFRTRAGFAPAKREPLIRNPALKRNERKEAGFRLAHTAGLALQAGSLFRNGAWPE
jgi:hypothetical protein